MTTRLKQTLKKTTKHPIEEEEEEEPSPTQEEFQVFLPSKAPCDIPLVPGVYIRETPSMPIISGQGLSGYDVDDLPEASRISRGVAKWYKKNIVVNMDTYGGAPTEEHESRKFDIGDYSCMFYSCLKAILPEVENVSQTWKTGKVHALERGRLTRLFKANIAEYLFTDLNQPTDEELNELDMTAEEYQLDLENKIKKKYILSNIETLAAYYYILDEAFNLRNTQAKQSFIQRLRLSIEARNNLLSIKEELKLLIFNSGEDENTQQNLEEINNQLNSPEFEYNIILREFEQLYPDPRYHLWTSQSVGMSDDQSKQYAFSHEIRSLPLTMGIFNLPVIFFQETDMRGDEFNNATNVPNSGTYKPETIIDQMFYRKFHGIATLDLICQVTGFNVFCLDSTGYPHPQFLNRGPWTGDFDVLQIILDRTVKNEFVLDNLSMMDHKAPCIVIKFQASHFESIAVLHKIETECKEGDLGDKKIPSHIFQAQTVFSYYDPFIQAIMTTFTLTSSGRLESGEGTLMVREKKKEKKKEEEEEKDKSKGKPTITIKGKSKYNQNQLEKTGEELKEEGLLHPDADKNEQLAMIRNIAENLSISVDHYIKEKSEVYDSKHTTPTAPVSDDPTQMTHAQRIVYFNKEVPEWRENVQSSGLTTENYLRLLSGMQPLPNIIQGWDEDNDTAAEEFELLSLSTPSSSSPSSSTKTAQSPTKKKTGTSPTQREASPTRKKSPRETPKATGTAHLRDENGRFYTVRVKDYESNPEDLIKLDKVITLINGESILNETNMGAYSKNEPLEVILRKNTESSTKKKISTTKKTTVRLSKEDKE